MCVARVHSGQAHRQCARVGKVRPITSRPYTRAMRPQYNRTAVVCEICRHIFVMFDMTRRLLFASVDLIWTLLLNRRNVLTRMMTMTNLRNLATTTPTRKIQQVTGRNFSLSLSHSHSLSPFQIFASVGSSCVRSQHTAQGIGN